MASIPGYLKERIMEARLTKKEGEIAEYILNNPSTTCFMSTSDLAKKLGTSNTSVNRASKALGYRVFSDLQAELQNWLTQYTAQPDYQLSLNQRLDNISGSGGNISNSFNQYLSLTCENLQNILQKNSAANIERVVDILIGSRTIYVHGYRGTSSIADKLVFLLRMITSSVVGCIREDEVTIIEKTHEVTPNDCIVVFSFNRYYRITSQIIEISKTRGARIILITDRITAPFTQDADETLVVDVNSMSFFNSNIPVLFLVELICTRMAILDSERSRERLDMIEPYLSKTLMR